MTEATKKIVPEEYIGMLPMMSAMKRPLEAEHLAGTAVFFASDDAELVTGQTLCVDGGTCMPATDLGIDCFGSLPPRSCDFGSVGAEDAEVAAVELDGPAGLVDDVVVVVAEQDEAVEFGFAAVGPGWCGALGTSRVVGCSRGTGTLGRGRRVLCASARVGRCAGCGRRRGGVSRVR